MRRGIGRLRAGGGGTSTDSDASAWAAAVTANGGTYSPATLAAVSAFAAAAKASGYWTKLNRINLFCGNQLASALVPLKVGGGGATDTNVNFVAGDYTEATGITGNGSTKYLRTGLIPSVSLVANNTHLAVYNREGAATGGGNHLGARDATNFLELRAPGTDAQLRHLAYGSGSVIGAVVAPYGLVGGSRTSSTFYAVYKNGAEVANSAVGVSGTPPTVEVYVFTSNNNGGGTVLPSASPLAGYSIGSGLSPADWTAYSTHMQTFQTALSRNV